MPDTTLKEYLLNTPAKIHWRRIGFKKRCGVAVPLFSIYSKKSLGIGELDDLRLLIDWAVHTGNSIIQLLPLNEMGALFCPYDALSSFALEPVYISLRLLPQMKKSRLTSRIESISKAFSLHNKYVDYRIKERKLGILQEIFFQDDKYDSPEFKKFRDENSYWLDDFGVYKVLKSYQQNQPWYEWEEKYRNRDKDHLNIFRREHQKEIDFQIWVQWQLYKQFREVKRYAQSKKVLLGGDLPILVSRDSADVWSHQEFFKLEFAAGAPPDMYCAQGQRWGMPTYNWERIAADDYCYLKEKLRFAENFYDLLRLDHVVGLFRIWSIPYNEPPENKGLNGFFEPQDEKVWPEHGRERLSVILKNTKMLVSAEDLGIIPQTCPETLKELGIPGTDVQRWMKDWEVKHDFLAPKKYRTLSMAMLSTHDTTNWPAWWENEAGTVDEDLFIRKCSDQHKINYPRVKDQLFDLALSRHGRLRWANNVDSVDKLVNILGKQKEAVKDFLDMYENSDQEKEKLWKHLGISGPMREKSDSEILRKVLKMTLESNSLFCINTIIDWLYLADIFKGDPEQYRINTPGTISEKNWSLRLPISLEELLKHRVNKQIHRMIADAGRI